MPNIGDFPTLPFSGSTPIARNASYQGAKTAQPRAGSQSLKVLLAIKGHSMLTDHELVELTDLPLATVNARRNWLARKGLIVACGSKIGPFGASNCLWTIAK